MAGKSTGDITDLLVRWNSGDEDAASKLLPVVYAELRKLARGYLRKERQDHSLLAACQADVATVACHGERAQQP